MMAYLDGRRLALGLALAGLCSACGDDSNTSADSTDGGSTTGMPMLDDDATGTTAPSVDSSAGSESDGTTTGVDSTDGVDSTTGVDDTTSGTTGPGNLPPTAHHDPYAILFGTVDLTVDAASGALANDRDPEDDALEVTASDAASAQGGTVTMEADGAFVYTAPVGYWGEDSFGYTIEDSEGQSAEGVVNIAIAPLTLDLADIGGGHYGFRIDGHELNIEAGDQVANAGDVDGDGLDDIVISSPLAAGGLGQAWVVFGKVDGLLVDLADVVAGVGGFAITGELAGEDFGIELDGGGDVNGDGLADIVIGAPEAGIGGAAYVVFGKADGNEVTVADLELGIGGFVMTGSVVGDEAGTSVAMLGDVNGDGYGDLAVGAPFAGTVPDSGRTYVVHGRTATTPIPLGDVLGGMGGFVINGEGLDDHSGFSVGGGGDANGDGLADIVVGAPDSNVNGGNSGAAYVVFGKTTTNAVNLISAGAAAFSIHGITGADIAGVQVEFAGDVNGDGRDDVMVGATGSDDDLMFQGRVFVVFGKGDGTDVELSDVVAGIGGFVIDGESGGDFVGQAVGGLGDLNADGYADLVIGAQNADVAGSNSGRTHVVFGKPNGAVVELSAISLGQGGFAMDGEAAVDRSGGGVAGGGDYDGDGYRDVIVAASGADFGGGSSGSVYVIFGAGWTGRVGYVGGDAADIFVGAPAPEGMVGGQGADLLGGGGGSDILYGGAGPDTIALTNAQFFRVHGGSGADTLALADADMTLNLGIIPNNSIKDVELIDLTGTGDNALILTGADVKSMAGVSRVVRVVGDDGDSVDADLSGAGWVDGGIAGGFQVYNDGLYALELSTDLALDISLL